MQPEIKNKSPLPAQTYFWLLQGKIKELLNELLFSCANRLQLQ